VRATTSAEAPVRKVRDLDGCRDDGFRSGLTGRNAVRRNFRTPHEDLTTAANRGLVNKEMQRFIIQLAPSDWV